MNRRHFILAGAGLALGRGQSARSAPGFAPTRFTVEVRGTGPDVILIPGLSSGRDVWAAMLRTLPGYRYHLLQVAGFAGEPARGNGRGPILAPLADEIVRYVRDRGLRRPVIIGHSMGGTLAMMIAARYPQLVGRIMVVDMTPAPAQLFGQSATGMGPIAGGLLGLAQTQSGQRLFGSLMASFSPPGSSLRTSDPGVVARALDELARIDLTGILPSIRAPLAIVYASPDRRARAAIDRAFAAAYAAARGARLTRIDDSGHMVMLDQPARLAEAVRAFLGAP